MKILLIDDDSAITRTLELHLKGDHQPLTAGTVAAARRLWEGERPDVVVLDPPRAGAGAIRRALRRVNRPLYLVQGPDGPAAAAIQGIWGKLRGELAR